LILEDGFKRFLLWNGIMTVLLSLEGGVLKGRLKGEIGLRSCGGDDD
jgi:hypothetical protein